jgi:flagellar motor switch protein FliG
MAVLEAEDRVAILLHLMGGEVVEHALAQLPPEQAELVRGRLANVEKSPPPSDEIDDVLDDFERSLRVTAEAAASLLQAFQAPTEEPAQETESAAPETPAPVESPPEPVAESTSEESPPPEEPAPESQRDTESSAFEPSDDPIADLQRLAAPQVAGALKDENPRTAALVLSCLPAGQAAEILRLIPDPLRSQAFMRLTQAVGTPSPLLLRVVRTVVERAATLAETSAEEANVERKMVEMLRAMNKKTRSQMLETIGQEDPDLVERLRQQLFAFEDVLRVEPRSLQRLLMEIDMETLLAALRNADQRIVDKIMNNVSKRTRETLTEEMQYMAAVPDDRIESARATIARQLAELDEQGQLVMED